jgi:hypothetical protein
MANTAPKVDPVNTVKSTVTDVFFSLTNRVKAAVNRILPPERRENLRQRLVLFATSHPVVATLLLSQVAFSGIPIILFVLLTVGVLVFSLVAALVVGILAALLFTVFCVGFALLILLPTLFITTFTGVGVWLWGWGAYHIVKWFGSSDTEQLTKLSSGLTSKFLGKPPGEEEDTTQNGDEDEKSPPSHEQGATTNGGSQKPSGKSQSQGTKTGTVDPEKTIGDVKKKANVSNVTSVAGV